MIVELQEMVLNAFKEEGDPAAAESKFASQFEEHKENL